MKNQQGEKEEGTVGDPCSTLRSLSRSCFTTSLLSKESNSSRLCLRRLPMHTGKEEQETKGRVPRRRGVANTTTRETKKNKNQHHSLLCFCFPPHFHTFRTRFGRFDLVTNRLFTREFAKSGFEFVFRTISVNFRQIKHSAKQFEPTTACAKTGA